MPSCLRSILALVYTTHGISILYRHVLKHGLYRIVSSTSFHLLACLYKVKECLCDTPGAHPRERAHDQNVQFLCLGQFLGNYKG